MIEYENKFDTQLQAEEAAKAYKQGYPPQGYGTITFVFYDNTRGVWVMRATRFSSCD